MARLPWLQFKTRDWLDSKELRRCSPEARGLLMDLIALAHEGEPYGHLRDKFEPLPERYLCDRFHLPRAKYRKMLQELLGRERVSLDNGVLIIPQMVEDERIRQARAEGGKLGGNPALKLTTEGYPSEPKNGLSPPRVRASLVSLSSSLEGVQGKPPDDAEDPGQTVIRWTRALGQAKGVVLEPDIRYALRITRAMFDAGKTLEDLSRIFDEIAHGKAKPQGIGWLIQVIEGKLSYVA